MKALMLILTAALFAACAPMVNVDKIGNEYAQHSYSRNFWWPNYDRTTFCWKLDLGSVITRYSSLPDW